MLRLLPSALCLIASALALSACGPEAGDPPSAPGASVSEADAEAALAAFGLAEPGRASWTDRRYEDGAFTFDGLVITDEDGVVEADRLVLAGVRSEAGQGRFDALALDGLTVRSDTGEARLERLELDEPGPALAADIAAAFAGRERDDRDGADPAGDAFARFALAGLAAQVQEETGAPVTFAIEAVEADNYDGARLDRFSMQGLSLDSEDADAGRLELRLANAEFDGLGAGLVALVSEQAAAQPFGGALTPSDLYERVSITGLSLLVAGVQIEMPSFTGAVEEEAGGALRSVGRMDSLTLSAASGNVGAEFARSLDMLGYDRFELSFAGESLYDPETDRVQTVGENYLALTDGFRMELEQDLSGIAAYAQAYAGFLAAGGAAGETPPADVFEPLLLHRFSLRLEDQSLMDRAIGAFAANQGSTSEQVRQQASALVMLGLGFAGGALPADVLTQTAGALPGFITQGGVLSLSMDPAEPVSVARLMEPGLGGLDASTLGVSIRHEDPGDAPAPGTP